MAFAAINLFAELAEGMVENELDYFDQMFRQWIENYQSPSLTSFFTIITEMGSSWFITILTLTTALALLYKQKRWQDAAALIIMVGTGSLFTIVFKHLFQRERPMEDRLIDAIGYSFPSGHSVGSMVFYGFLIYLCMKIRWSPHWKASLSFILGVIIILVGFSRIYLEAHYVTDVIAGFSLGFFFLALGIIWNEWWFRKKNE
ncbi:phosphoesterase [Thermoflavimicrobium daqui]|uniref:Phosphoesterase n=2 Tax=Thermoflavimicrobium daqui TaxID=2137476 RepID=A0A364K5W3_9BACL|nr:phosphoesterase [Thermoflavimicrobium daqui]